MGAGEGFVLLLFLRNEVDELEWFELERLNLPPRNCDPSISGMRVFLELLSL